MIYNVLILHFFAYIHEFASVFIVDKYETPIKYSIIYTYILLYVGTNNIQSTLDLKLIVFL